MSGNAATTLTLASTKTQTVVPSLAPCDRLAWGTQTATATTLAYRNTTSGRYALVIVTPKTAATTQYTLSVTTR